MIKETQYETNKYKMKKELLYFAINYNCWSFDIERKPLYLSSNEYLLPFDCTNLFNQEFRKKTSIPLIIEVTLYS